MAANPIKSESTSPVETVYSGAAPVEGKEVVMVDEVEVDSVLVTDAVDDSVFVFDVVVVVVVVVFVAETVGAEPVGTGVALVALTEVGAGANTDDKSDRAEEIAADAWDKTSGVPEATSPHVS